MFNRGVIRDKMVYPHTMQMYLTIFMCVCVCMCIKYTVHTYKEN